MLILPQTVEMTCRPNNKKYLLSKGYEWKYNQVISVNVLDLKATSEFKVNLLCDYCLDKGISKIVNSIFKLHAKNRNNNLKDCCTDCQGLKGKDTMMKKYSVTNANYLPHVAEAHQERMDKRKHKLEDIEKEFINRNYVLVSTEYINSKLDLEYICLEHVSKGIQTVTYSNFNRDHGCLYCGRESTVKSQTGDKSHFWKGGITPLSSYMREKMIQWKKDSLKFHNFKCVISGEQNDRLIVHHTYSFSQILKETLFDLNLPIYNEINNYTFEELKSIEELCTKKHYEYGLGVPLLHEIHEDFHRMYGKGDNTLEQFEEFKNKYTYQTEKVVMV